MDNALEVDPFAMITAALVFGAGGLFLGFLVGELAKKFIESEKVTSAISFTFGIPLAIIGGLIGLFLYLKIVSYFASIG
jgi:hypothetical protein